MTGKQNELPSTEWVNLTDDIAQNATNAVAPALAYLAQMQQVRAEQLDNALARLSANLGTEDPRVAELQRAGAAAKTLERALHSEATHLARRPTVHPNEWLVFGGVRDAKGQPVTGARVRVFDRDRKFDDLLGDTTTDEYGDFAAIYHERDFAEVGEGLPELYLMVTDAQGQLLYSTRDTIRYQAGRGEYFEIVLGKTPPPVRATGARAKPKRSMPKRKKKT